MPSLSPATWMSVSRALVTALKNGGEGCHHHADKTLVAGRIVSPQSSVEVLTPGTCGCDLIWKQGLCRCD